MRIPRLLIAIALAGCASPAPSLQSLRLGGVSECGGVPLGEIGAVHVAIAIDASSSTRRPSQADINGDGEIGRIDRSQASDPGDSVLAAQVAAVRSLVRAVTPIGVRLSVVSYSGPTQYPVGLPIKAIVRAELTANTVELDRGLDLVLRGGSGGTSNFAGGIRRALQTLIDAPTRSANTRHLIFFLSDSAHPILPQPSPLVQYPKRDPQMKIAATRAIEEGVRIHTFALGDAVEADVPNALTRIAGATGGLYHTVERADRLHCDLIAALVVGGVQ